MSALPTAPAPERNKYPILEVLHDEFRGRTNVLEIGSGTGQHAVFFAAELPWLTWHTSDLPENHAVILAWLDQAGLDNVRAPLSLDVAAFDERLTDIDAVFSANTAHIMNLQAVECMFRLVGRTLPEGGVFCLYGPFNFDGGFSSDSNAAFDASLRQRDAAMGIRNLEDLEKFAGNAGMERVRLYAMPANNHIAVWKKNGSGARV